MTPGRKTNRAMAILLAASLLGTLPACATHRDRDDEAWERKYSRSEVRSGATERRSDGTTPPPQPADRPTVGDRAADYALRMIGKPYRYGGTVPSTGFDCSGLVQFSYKNAGVAVPRTTDALRHASAMIQPPALRRGDLVFFNQEGKKYGHLGIYVGGGEFVHAPSSGGRVRRDSLHSPYWRKHFSEARRITI